MYVVNIEVAPFLRDICSLKVHNSHGVFEENIEVAPFFAGQTFPKSTQHSWGERWAREPESVVCTV